MFILFAIAIVPVVNTTIFDILGIHFGRIHITPLLTFPLQTIGNIV